MKNFLNIAVLLLLLTSCEFRNIEIKGTAPGMENTTVTIGNGGRGGALFAENIVDGTFSIPQQPLENPGYYHLNIRQSGPGNRGTNHSYEVYLEPGKYNIAIDTGARPRYPIITSSSAIQNDLTIYHRFTDSVMRGIREESNKWMNKFNDPSAMLLPDKEYQDVLAKVKIWQDKSAAAVLTILSEFASKYPNNLAILHAMSTMNLAQGAAKFFDVYQKLGKDVKNSEDGKKIGDKLKTLATLVPGATAPELAGLTPDGKKLNVKDLHKKVVIVSFWRSGSKKMREENFALAYNLLPRIATTKVGAISVSFDTDRNIWLASIKEGKLYWPQVSDLKGDDSPNAKNWNATSLPVYFILDGNGKVIYNYLSYDALEFSINEYLRNH